MWYRQRYPKSQPRPARGGIKARSKAGAFGQTWWARRWVSVLEGLDLGGRLNRGRRYARGGQVLSIDLSGREVRAKVQGSQVKPYAVSVRVAALADDAWDRVMTELAAKPVFVARLLAGEMPEEIETAFTAAGLSLFPGRASDLQTSCSCPDAANPCKHIAAVYLLLGEEFDRDPFLLFQLRGMGRPDLIARLGTKTMTAGDAGPAGPAVAAEDVRDEPLPSDPAAFWAAGRLPDDLFGDVTPPAVSAALPRRLGAFPFWRGGRSIIEALDPLYARASRAGLERFLGAPPPRGRESPG